MYSIREAAINVLQAVAKEFGPDWAREHVVAQVGWGWVLGRSVATAHHVPPTLIGCLISSLHTHPANLTTPNPTTHHSQVLTLVNSDNYLHRMTVLSAIGALAGSVSKEVVHNSMLPAVVACSKVRAGWLAGWVGC